MIPSLAALPNKYIALAAIAAIPTFFQLARSTGMHRFSAFEEESLVSTSDEFVRTSTMLGGYRPRLLNANEIVQRSYRNTFGSLSTETSCRPGNDAKTCITHLRSEANRKSETNAKSFPWWFMTMLRDARGPMMGFWHNLTIMDPPMDFCTIEKVATTQWRHVQCYLNEGKEPISMRPVPCNLNKTRLGDRRQSERQVSRVVMLRDPLERLLSGYIDKCDVALRRHVEGSCEPMTVFNETEMTLGIREDRKQLFAAYVDAFPLKWNFHFFPQGMYCDGLFRHFRNYDFVGYMGKGFYGNLTDLNAKLGRTGSSGKNKLPEALEKVFHVSHELAGHQNTGNVGTETRAPEHVKEYFTAASVRRALEYFAVDYVMLGLEIPNWVHDILAEEHEMFMN